MSLLHRFARLCKADMHGILDSIEDPGVVVKQSIRDMQADISRHEQSLELLKKSHARLLQQHLAQEQRIRSTEEEIILCVKANNQQLTKSTIRRKLEALKCADFVQREVQSVAKDIEQSVTMLANRKTQLQQIQHKFEILGAEECTAPFSSPSAQDTLHVTDEEVEVAFLKTVSEHSSQCTSNTK